MVVSSKTEDATQNAELIKVRSCVLRRRTLNSPVGNIEILQLTQKSWLMAACGNKARSQSQPQKVPQKVPMKPPQTERGGTKCFDMPEMFVWEWAERIGLPVPSVGDQLKHDAFHCLDKVRLLHYYRYLESMTNSQEHTTKDGNGFLNCEESVVWGRAAGRPAELQVCRFSIPERQWHACLNQDLWVMIACGNKNTLNCARTDAVSTWVVQIDGKIL